jgi:hypothetical protein
LMPYKLGRKLDPNQVSRLGINRYTKQAIYRPNPDEFAGAVTEGNMPAMSVAPALDEWTRQGLSRDVLTGAPRLHAMGRWGKAYSELQDQLPELEDKAYRSETQPFNVDSYMNLGFLLASGLGLGFLGHKLAPTASKLIGQPWARAKDWVKRLFVGGEPKVIEPYVKKPFSVTKELLNLVHPKMLAAGPIFEAITPALGPASDPKYQRGERGWLSSFGEAAKGQTENLADSYKKTWKDYGLLGLPLLYTQALYNPVGTVGVLAGYGKKEAADEAAEMCKDL